jgi:hypothetical protein
MIDCEPCEADVPFRPGVQTGRRRMRALFWTIAALIAVLAAMWLYGGAPQVQVGRPIVLGRAIENTVEPRPQPESAPHTPEHSLRDRTAFRVRDRVFHATFGHGTVTATDGPKLTIAFDHAGVKRVIDSYVVKSEEPRPPD